ncbi:hypothetical protein ACFQV2_30475 [Actinokineospora soli]|uniref:Uncharacterized protein n=1 Tax=Actinokineospora soli TaxID=1048753 RepID=A0ABW2TTS0_9PSEU
MHGVFRVGSTVFALDTRAYSDCCARVVPEDAQAVAAAVVSRLRQVEAASQRARCSTG